MPTTPFSLPFTAHPGAFGDWLEDLGREVRYRLGPKARRTYADLAARGHDPADTRPIAACDFRSPRIDSTGAR